MNKKCFYTLALSSLFLTGSFAGEEFGVVNFGSIVEESKLGQEKQKEIRKFSDDLQNKLKEKHTEYTDLEKKLADPEYLDALSPEEEKDQQQKKQQLAQTFGQMQMNFQEMMQQKQQKFVQTMIESAQGAAKEIAKEKKLKLIVSKEACLYYDDGLDITDNVVEMLNKKHKSVEEKQ